MLKDAIDTFEELKKYTFIISRGSFKNIIIRFNNNNFYHLIGLHKTNIDMFFPSKIKSKDKKYKYIKKNIDKFENILNNQIKEQNLLVSRIESFPKIIDMLKVGNNTMLFNLKQKSPGSMYDGDYGLLKWFDEKLCCLFGLKIESEEEEFINCVPQSWMASNRTNRLVEGRKPIYIENISCVPNTIMNSEINL